jgi:membrane protein
MTQIPQQLVIRWWRENLAFVAAAVSFYLLVAFAPLMAFLAGLLGLLLQQDTVRNILTEQVQSLSNPMVAQAANGFISSLRGFTNNDILTSAISFIALLWAAAGLFVQLQNAFNSIFGVVAPKKSPILLFAERYILAILFVFSLGMLVLVYILSSPVISTVELLLTTAVDWAYWKAIITIGKISLTITLLALLLTAVYKVLPSLKVKFTAAFAGGLIAAVIYAIGAQMLGIYFATGAVNSTYGVASSIVLVLLWIYFAAQVLIFGALITSQLNGHKSLEGV